MDNNELAWYQRMREGGFQGIVKQPRSDRGKPRRPIQSRVTRAVAIKREQPLRSDLVINKILRAELGAELPSSTLYRHLRIQGATRKQLGVAKEKVRCRWTRELPNALWQGDFEHGPIRSRGSGHEKGALVERTQSSFHRMADLGLP